ncbi:hypothetical protein IMZ48_46260 [Candidatus Bathyarchaeota archaeon]|nr:hypothetical protein [Candidatus Bathyarchaeota archaeon]
MSGPRRHRHSAAAFAALISIAATQETSPFTDPTTGIIFQQFFGAKTNFAFGIALPMTPTDSFIGQFTFPLSQGEGWGGISLTGDMEGPLLLAAWSDGTNVVSSFRQAFNEEDNPPEVTGTFSLRPITEGTSVNGTFLTFTFLCEGCLSDGLGLAAADTAGVAEMGWALSSIPVRNAETPAGVLDFHDSGFGDFDADLAGAKNAEFETWAALAGDPVGSGAGAVPIDLSAEGGGSGDEDGGDDSGDDSDGDD